MVFDLYARPYVEVDNEIVAVKFINDRYYFSLKGKTYRLHDIDSDIPYYEDKRGRRIYLDLFYHPDPVDKYGAPLIQSRL